MEEPNGFSLTEKLGPLPVWLWALLGVGLVFVVYKLYGKKAATSVPVATAITPASDLSTTTDGVDTSIQAGTGTGLGDTTSVGNASGAQTPTNALWESQAVSQISAQLGASPLTVQTAIEDYLDGIPYTPAQGNYIDAAISALGVPPQPLVSTPTTAPTNVSYSYIQYGDGAIAQVGSDGSRYGITTNAQYIALGSPPTTHVNYLYPGNTPGATLH